MIEKIKLWWALRLAGIRAASKSLAVHRRGLRPRQPGGNAHDRRKFWRYPQRHVLFEEAGTPRRRNLTAAQG